jgi:D-sedoheptulose 7-phosphate isomerase
MTLMTSFADTYLGRLSVVLSSLPRKQVDDAVSVIAHAWQSGKQIITLGNGGSSMTALHFINDWNKSVFLSTGKPFRGRSLVDNMGLVMSYGNDLSFEDIFIEQLKNIMMPGDLVIAISGSGNSENVVRAINYANQNGAVTLGLCGYKGGKLKELAQHVVWAEVEDMQLSEDVHSIFGHIVMQQLCGTHSK